MAVTKMAVTKVAVINLIATKRYSFMSSALLLLIAALLSCTAWSAVLPEDRADVMYYAYDGDDSTFEGPAVLVRKNYKDKVSLWGDYYVDLNSSASIDVMTQGSPFEERRDQYSVGMDYLHGKTLMSTSYTISDENDYESESWSVGVSQDFFGDLSTFTMSYSNAEDFVYQNLRDGPGADDITGRTPMGPAYHQRYGIGWTQVMTKSWIMAFNADATVDEGFLRNPYRSVRYVADVDGENVSVGREQENYPTTRASEAYAIKNMVYLPYRAAVKLEYRVFSDNWDIEASNYEIRYTHPYGDDFIFELRYRAYEQTQAFFYSDLFNYQNEFEFKASDKELSAMSNSTIGFGVTYELDPNWLGWFDRGTLNFYFDRIDFSYDNFRDKKLSQSPDGGVTAAPFQPGQEPLFEFTANTVRMFVSVWY